MRFVDTFIFVDDAEFESKHKRDDDGQFAKESGSKSETEANKEPEKTVSENSSFDELSDSISDKKTAKKAVELATKKLYGDWTLKTQDGEITISVTSKSREEANNKIGRARTSDSQAVEMAKAHIFALKNISEIFQGLSTDWQHRDDHNATFEFKTFYRRMKYLGKEPLFCIDVSRIVERPKGRKFLYSVTKEGNPGFEVKRESLKLKDSGCEIVLVDIRCSMFEQ